MKTQSTPPITFLQNQIEIFADFATETTDIKCLKNIITLANLEQQTLIGFLWEKTVPTPSTGILSKSFTSTAVSEAEAEQIRRRVSSQIAQIQAKYEQIKQSSLGLTTSRLIDSTSTGRTFLGQPISSISTPVPAIGFKRQDSNCWCNCLLQMVIHLPSIRTAYEFIGYHYMNDRNNPLNKRHGSAMVRALLNYDSRLRKGKAVPSQVSQTVRVAMNHFFPTISLSSKCNEDAYDAMQLLMGKYQEIAKEEILSRTPSLYRLMKTKRIYEAEGLPRAADPFKLKQTKQNPDAPDAYTRLPPDLTSSLSNLDYQIFLDLQNQSHLCFNDLVKTYFCSESQEGEPGVYLRPDDQIQDFKLKSERRQFETIPEELVLTIKRFGFNREASIAFKITTPLTVPRAFALPQEAIKAGKQPIYDLDFFIVHNGEYDCGHYISYRKIQGSWFQLNDDNVRCLSEEEIDDILGNPRGSTYTSYIHHYSIRTQQAQSPAFSSHSGIAPSLFHLFPSIDSLIVAAKSQVSASNQFIRNLEELNQLIKDPSSAKNAIDRSIATLPKDVLDILDYFIKIERKMRDAPNDGTSIGENNPRYLASILTPHISPTGGNLIEQMIAYEKAKKQQYLDANETVLKSYWKNIIEQLKNAKEIEMAQNEPHWTAKRSKLTYPSSTRGNLSVSTRAAKVTSPTPHYEEPLDLRNLNNRFIS